MCMCPSKHWAIGSPQPSQYSFLKRGQWHNYSQHFYVPFQPTWAAPTSMHSLKFVFHFLAEHIESRVVQRNICHQLVPSYPISQYHKNLFRSRRPHLTCETPPHLQHVVRIALQIRDFFALHNCVALEPTQTVSSNTPQCAFVNRLRFHHVLGEDNLNGDSGWCRIHLPKKMSARF